MRPVPVSPRDVNLLVTARCNLACRHCSVYGEGEIKGDLAAEQWVSIIRRLADWKVLKLTISGGEPLAREDLPEIIEAILARPFRFSLNTNAMLVTEDLARALARAAPRLESVMVSLDGARPGTHDEQRAPGAFEAMAEGVERLRRAGVPVGFYCTVTRLNVREIEDIAEWGVSRGGYVKFNDVLSVGRACADRELALDAATRREAAGRAAALAEKLGPKITGTLLDMHRFAERILAGAARPYPQGSRGCGAMRAKLSIWPDGRVTPCDRIPHETVGNVLESPLEKIWQGTPARRFREMLAVPIGEVQECRDCEYLPYCTGGCPVLPMRERTVVGFLRGDRTVPGGEILGRDPASCVRDFLGEGVPCG